MKGLVVSYAHFEVDAEVSLLNGRAYHFFSLLRDRLHREELPSVVLNATEKYKCNGGSVSLNGFEDVLFPKRVFAFARCDFNDRVGRVEAVRERLRCKSILYHRRA